jgi:hypothetical protein
MVLRNLASLWIWEMGIFFSTGREKQRVRVSERRHCGSLGERKLPGVGKVHAGSLVGCGGGDRV